MGGSPNNLVCGSQAHYLNYNQTGRISGDPFPIRTGPCADQRRLPRVSESLPASGRDARQVDALPELSRSIHYQGCGPERRSGITTDDGCSSALSETCSSRLRTPNANGRAASRLAERKCQRLRASDQRCERCGSSAARSDSAEAERIATRRQDQAATHFGGLPLGGATANTSCASAAIG